MTGDNFYSITVVFNLSYLNLMNNLHVNTAQVITARQISLGNIIHDLESPLTLAQFNLDQLYLKVSNDDTDLIELLKPAITGVKEMSSMISSIKSQKNYAPYSINHEITEILNIYKNRCKGDNITLKYISDSNIILYHYKAQFKSIINNLISNAIKAHINSNKVAKYISINIKNHKNGINIIIRDNADGLSKDIQKNIKINKLPLNSGLRLVYSNVQNIFQGDIKFSTVRGFGTEFNIVLD